MNLAESRRAVKTGWKLLVRELGGVEAATACTRASRSLVSDYGNVESARFVPADVVLEAEAVAGKPHVTAALARAAGYELVMVEAPAGQGELAALVAEFSTDVGETFATLAHALTRESLAPEDKELLLREFGALNRVSGQVLHFLKGTP